eukprot:gene13500-28639_t
MRISLLTIAFISVTLSAIKAITLRVRLIDGQYKRIDVGEEDTLSNTKKILQSLGISMTNSTTIMFRSSALDFETQSSTRIVKDLKATAGEILTVVSEEKTTKITSIRGEVSGLPIKQSELDSNPSSASASRRPVNTISEIAKRRNSLVKMTRQPPSTNSSVRVCDSTGRILDRMAAGRICLLLGKYHIDETTKVPHKNIDVLGVYELCNGSTLPPDGDISGVVSDVKAISAALGMEVLGCGMGVTGDKLWSPEHVYVALRLQTLSDSSPSTYTNTPFIVLSATHTIQSTGSSQRKAPSSTGRAVPPSSERTLSLEAHHLSDQALFLHATGILPTATTTSTASSESKNSDNNNNIVLNSPVLVQSDEATSIDPLLLAVPVAIRPLLQITSTSGKSTQSKSSSPLELEHVFPTAEELTDAPTALRARSHLLRLIRQRGKGKALKTPLRDPHLLMHLASLMDKPSLFALCVAVGDLETEKLPSQLGIVLEMLEMTLADDSDMNEDE